MDGLPERKIYHISITKASGKNNKRLQRFVILYGISPLDNAISK